MVNALTGPSTSDNVAQLDPDIAIEVLANVVGDEAASTAVHDFIAAHSGFDAVDGDLRNPGHHFAARLGLPAYEWLSGHYVETYDGPRPSDWIVVGERPPDDLTWTPVATRPADPSVATLRPPGVETVIGSRPIEGRSQSSPDGPWHWRYSTEVRGHNTATVSAELVRRARAAGYHVDEIALTPSPLSTDRHLSLWHQNDNTVQAMVDTRGRVTTISLTSPIVAQDYLDYPRTKPDNIW
jgi:hypothetical protein